MNLETICDDLVGNTLRLIKEYDIPIYAVREALNKDLSDSSVRIQECKRFKHCPQDKEFRDKLENICEFIRSIGGTVDVPNTCTRNVSLRGVLDVVHSMAMIQIRDVTREYFLELLQDLEVK